MDSKKNKSKTYLNQRGYIIRKACFPDEEIQRIKNELTVSPILMQDYGIPPEKFTVYRENESKLYIPKFYGINNFGKPEYDDTPTGKTINVKFASELRPNQLEPVKLCIESFNKTGGGILSLPCGFGKTIIGIYLICHMKCKTLIIVHKEFLLNQWIERIKDFIPDAKIGIIQQDKFDLDCDIAIGMLQSIAMKSYAPDAFNSFGFTIIDECHRISSKVYSRALQKVSCKYILGLSATPNRKDGLSKVLEWYSGPLIYEAKRELNVVPKVVRYKIIHESDVYSKIEELKNKKPNMSKMINNICYFLYRTKLISALIIDIFKSDDERNILILSDRIKHLNDIETLLIKSGLTDDDIGYYIGGTKQKHLDIAAKKRIILATYSMANEGLDIPSLNTLILASPKSDIVQALGRIMRKQAPKQVPTIYDFVDDFSVFTSQALKRLKEYRKKAYDIENWTIDIDNNKTFQGIDKSNSKIKVNTKSNIVKFEGFDIV